MSKFKDNMKESFFIVPSPSSALSSRAFLRDLRIVFNIHKRNLHSKAAMNKSETRKAIRRKGWLCPGTAATLLSCTLFIAFTVCRVFAFFHSDSCYGSSSCRRALITSPKCRSLSLSLSLCCPAS